LDSYNALLGTIQNQEYTAINLDMIGTQAHDLEELGEIFSEEEVWGVIKELPPDRAPGPDGFIGAFYKKAWAHIKGEIMAALLKLYVEILWETKSCTHHSDSEETGRGRGGGFLPN
jgi:hypothetical protein